MKYIYYIFIILLLAIDQQAGSMETQKNSDLKKSHKNPQAFNQACMKGDISRAITLLNSKFFQIPISSGKKEGLLPLHLASYKGYTDLVDAMIRKMKNTNTQKAFVNERVAFGKYNGCTALHLAAKKGHLLVAQLLVEKKADMNAQIASVGKRARCTPLHVAAIRNNPDIALLLCNNGALIEGGYGQTIDYTPLHNATFEGSIETARVLLAAGANPNNIILSEKRKGCPGHFLALKNKNPGFDYIKLLHILFAAGANPDARTPKNQTLLHVAQKKQYGSQVTQFLLTHGVPAHIQDSLGNTALHYAAMRSLKNNIALLRWFTNMNIKNHEDKRPVDLLPENTPEDILTIFKSEDNCVAERARMKLIKCITQNRKNIATQYFGWQFQR